MVVLDVVKWNVIVLLLTARLVFLKERLFDSSDPYEVPVCGECGLFARKLRTTDNLICDNCNNTKTIYKIKIPYAFKLLVQELQSIHITPRFILDN